MTIAKSCSSFLAILALSFSLSATATIIDFESFKIRNSNSTITPPYDSNLVITENIAGDGFFAVTPDPGQKVGYGTNAFDGMQINMINTVNWTTNPSATGNHPYLNMWVTDGANYAIISSENSYMNENFQTRAEWKIFEYGGLAGNLNWLFSSGIGSILNQYLQRDNIKVTLADFSDNIKLYEGPIGPTAGVQTGAPRGGFGFNVIFGDTQANFTGSDGYSISNLTVTVGQELYQAGNVAAVPEPSSLAIFALGVIGLAARRFKNQQTKLIN
tara:strand:+ start:9084 stop:9899 length:816 start_codon:yes stop_codon:yes gene_type:complete